MKFGAILGISICLNAILAVVQLSNISTAPPSTELKNQEQTRAQLQSSALPGAKSGSEVRRAWKALQSDDLRVYTSNLHHAGFPRPLIEKIIIAELDRRIAEEQRRAPRDTNYWKTGFQRDAAQRQAREEKTVAAEKRQERIRELLGSTTPQASGIGDNLWAAIHLTGVADMEKLDLLSGVIPRIPIGRAPDSDEARHAYDQAMTEIGNILGPEGLEEFQLRLIAADVTDVWGAEMLFGCVMTGVEFRELLRIRKQITPSLDRARGSRLENADTPPEIAQKVDEQIRALLGEERFLGYLRARNGGFKQIHTVFRAEETMELSWAVYDIYAALKEASERIHSQPTSTEAERRAALLALRNSTERALEAKLGPEKFTSYVVKNRDNFRWLTELTVNNPLQP